MMGDATVRGLATALEKEWVLAGTRAEPPTAAQKS